MNIVSEKCHNYNAWYDLITSRGWHGLDKIGFVNVVVASRWCKARQGPRESGRGSRCASKYIWQFGQIDFAVLKDVQLPLAIWTNTFVIVAPGKAMPMRKRKGVKMCKHIFQFRTNRFCNLEQIDFAIWTNTFVIVVPGWCKAMLMRKREGVKMCILPLLRYSPRLLAIGEKLRYSIR